MLLSPIFCVVFCEFERNDFSIKSSWKQFFRDQNLRLLMDLRRRHPLGGGGRRCGRRFALRQGKGESLRQTVLNGGKSYQKPLRKTEAGKKSLTLTARSITNHRVTPGCLQKIDSVLFQFQARQCREASDKRAGRHLQGRGRARRVSARHILCAGELIN